MICQKVVKRFIRLIKDQNFAE